MQKCVNFQRSARKGGFAPLLRVLAGIALIIAIPVSVCAQQVEPNPGQLMSSAFICATYAENAGTELPGSEVEQKRLFTLGYETGKHFLKGIEDGSISPAEVKKAPKGAHLGRVLIKRAEAA